MSTPNEENKPQEAQETPKTERVSAILPEKPQPKMVQKMAVRGAILMFVIAALLVGYRYVRQVGQDLGGLGSANTVDAIAAIERISGGGQRLVVFNADGTRREAPGHREGASDREFTWRPDGNQLFFSSDRKLNQDGSVGSYQIYRWNLATNQVEQRTIGTRSRANPSIGAAVPNSLLILTGGFVLELDPATSNTTQVLPPVGRDIIKGDEDGVVGQFDGVYREFGQSFRAAMWGPDRKYIAAIMARDTGEILIVQRMDATSAEDARPRAIVAGDRIWFDIDPRTGALVYAVVGFQLPTTDPSQVPPEFIKDGRIVIPLRHSLAMVNPLDPADRSKNGPIFNSQDDRVAFGQPRISPDGSMVLFTPGRYEGDGNFVPELMAVTPFRSSVESAPQPTPVVRAEVYEPAWHPDSDRIVFVKRSEAGRRSVFTIRRDGSRETEITKQGGSFSTPRFSPQAPAAQSATK